MQETRVRSLVWEEPLEREMATQSTTLAWKIPWTEELGELQSMGSQRVGCNLATEQQQQRRGRVMQVRSATRIKVLQTHRTCGERPQGRLLCFALNWHFVPETCLRSLPVLSHIPVSKTWWADFSYHLHFAAEQTEKERIIYHRHTASRRQRWDLNPSFWAMGTIQVEWVS